MVCNTLFIYDTLTNKHILYDILKRNPDMKKNSLCGFSMSGIIIENINYPAIIKNLSNNTVINGVTFTITPKEIIKIDKYETDAYQRIQVTLVDKTKAWTYVKK